jgi:hypothetical protein
VSIEVEAKILLKELEYGPVLQSLARTGRRSVPATAEIRSSSGAGTAGR